MKFFIQEKLYQWRQVKWIQTRNKQGLQMIKRKTKICFFNDRMARTVSVPNQAPVHLAKMSPQDLYYECHNKGDAWQCSIPTLKYAITCNKDMLQLGLQLIALHVQYRLHRKHFHHMVTLMRNLIVQLHHPKRQMQLK
jgi:hypothetical protein